MRGKNIVIAPCGNKSFLFREAWLKDESEKDFDICHLFYHNQIDHPDLYRGVDFFFHLKNFKYAMLYELLVNIRPEWLNEYEYFYFLDDDIQITTKDINQMFILAKTFGASISQACLSLDSYCSWPIFKRHQNCFLRFVGQIEVMAPLFHRDALKICIPSFIDNRSSWGMDSVWSKLLGYPEDKLIIFDSVVMKHTLPVGGGELYTKLGVNPEDEWHGIINKYGAKLHNYKEYGRLKSFHIKNNISYRCLNFFHENSSAVRRNIRDYNIGSRIKNRWNMLLDLKKQQ
ncbi:hypothetical protein [Pedobacter cryoconitis]|uniref:DUF707 domain-containing protein n=1 Tax=Pedobacter cryoconitis TaxID=188932 RepID=A0A7X0MH24_9SPHI|nr:hypothetical protein [Pedobacter cryoconitis]MBB6498947.1 hypothetical protein [Pedobacter cryoconitis]